MSRSTSDEHGCGRHGILSDSFRLRIPPLGRCTSARCAGPVQSPSSLHSRLAQLFNTEEPILLVHQLGITQIEDENQVPT